MHTLIIFDGYVKSPEGNSQILESILYDGWWECFTSHFPTVGKSSWWYSRSNMEYIWIKRYVSTTGNPAILQRHWIQNLPSSMIESGAFRYGVPPVIIQIYGIFPFAKTPAIVMGTPMTSWNPLPWFLDLLATKDARTRWSVHAPLALSGGADHGFCCGSGKWRWQDAV